MALQLSHTAASGVSGDYWRICDLNINYDREECHCKLALFKDAAASAAGNTPLEVHQYDWSGADFTGSFDSATLDVVSQNPQERAYEKLKASVTVPADFSTASDV